MVTIEKRIVSYKVKTVAGEIPVTLPVVAPELPKRPEILFGSTYKVKPVTSDHAMYITINDIVLDCGTIRPFEIFINSKDMEYFQWVVSLTRVISAIFRKGGNIDFLIEELGCIIDPTGGYFRKGKFIPSVVSEIGAVIDIHLKSLAHKA